MAGGITSLIGCGGGSSVAGLSSGGTGSFAAGTVKGLGSIIVNGVRYDSSKATVQRADDGSVGKLSPGMVVSIDATAVSAPTRAGALPTATAVRVTYCSEWIGKVDSIDLVSRTIIVLGQTVEVPPSAVFAGDAIQLSALNTQHYVEVHGYLNPSAGRLLATRVEVSNRAPSVFVLTGGVSSFDPNTRVFSLGSASVGYDTTVALPAGMSNGLLVRVSLDPKPVGGLWKALIVRSRQSVLGDLQIQDRNDADTEGVVTSLDGPSSLTINGSIPVDISSAQVTGVLAVGVSLEVRGAVVKGVLAATRVVVSSYAELEINDFDFLGTVSALDTAAQRFVVQGLDFSYTGSTVNLVQGWVTGATPAVSVKATMVAGNWVATEIRPEG